ncbi:MAG: M36 family metallopeptidase, partial [Terriglobales bacterium]
MKISEAHLRLPVRWFTVFLLFPLLVTLPPTSRLHAQVASASSAPNFHIQDTSTAVRVLSAEQQQGLANFQNGYGRQAVVRLDDFAGSVDAAWDFKTAPYSGDPAAAALAFISDQRALFGISDLGTLQLRKAQPALSGYLVRYDQVVGGVKVQGGGIGVAMNASQQVIAAFGPYYPAVAVSTTPSLVANDAVSRAQQDLAQFAVAVPPVAAEKVEVAFQALENSLGPFRQPKPELTILPTGDGSRLAWDFYFYSRNPFGVFRYSVDAHSGEVLSRQNQVRFQSSGNLVPATADIFPTHPAIDKNLQDQGIIPKDGAGRPLGQLRVNLRNFDASNLTTGAAGELTGTHAHVHNTLAVKLPFPQAALNTWHFARDLQPLEQTTREDVHFGPEAEPAEHQDEINVFFFINYLLEYITDLHIRDDNAQNPISGQGAFPDTFPNKDVPLQGLAHIPELPGLTCTVPGGSRPCPSPEDPEFLPKFLGLDNAFSLPLTTTVAGQEVIVNPTAYGHGFLFNDLAIEDGVPYHEGMHSISTPIAGFEGSIEGGALNEGQADAWAGTITQDPSLGEYVVNGFRLRQEIRDRQRFLAVDGNPDLVAWIRNANSGMLYSQLCRFNRATRAPDGNACEEHQDGEIYLAAMWDLREFLQMYQTGTGFLRPQLTTGQATVPISQGQETWERLFLGSIYVLGTTNPDTFVRARDALILADALLYPSGLSEPGNPRQVGMHRTLIEHVFAAREIGFNAKGPVGGRQTISTAVSSFTDAQPSLPRPKGVKATVFSDAVQVSWKPVSGALAYQIVKRRKGQTSGRLFPSDPATHTYS